jgi:hypothetical protein
MKKIAYLASAIVAGLGFSTAAQADVTVSGSGGLEVLSAGSTSTVYQGGSVTFALSTTTAGGIGISTSSGWGIDSDGADTDASGAQEFTALAFTAGGNTLTFATALEAPAGGGVGGVSKDLVSTGLKAADASAGAGDHTGHGVQLATSMGSASLTVAYIFDTDTTGNNSDTSGQDTAFGASVSMPMGPMTVTVNMAQDNGDSSTETGGNVAYAVGGGTLKVGYVDDSDGSANEISGSYSMSLDADTSVAVGYKSTDEGSSNSTVTEINLTRSLGGGVSVFLDYSSVGGSATASTVSGSKSVNDSALAFGTNIAF